MKYLWTLELLAAGLVWNRNDVCKGKMAGRVAVEQSQPSFSPTAYLFARGVYQPHTLAAAGC